MARRLSFKSARELVIKQVIREFNETMEDDTPEEKKTQSKVRDKVIEDLKNCKTMYAISEVIGNYWDTDEVEGIIIAALVITE